MRVSITLIFFILPFLVDAIQSKCLRGKMIKEGYCVSRSENLLESNVCEGFQPVVTSCRDDERSLSEVCSTFIQGYYVCLKNFLLQVNETQLNKVLELVAKSRNNISEIDEETQFYDDGTLGLDSNFVSVLYYARWCPFSREFHPIFAELAEMNPCIKHIAVEEQNIRLRFLFGRLIHFFLFHIDLYFSLFFYFFPTSSLSRMGIHSFPAILLYNQTSRVRFRGKRDIENLQEFYENMTGSVFNEILSLSES